ncbi:MAG TPA: DUF3667 domain-containing protein [Rhizomicrobium sp.]|jgi:hypothetical protein
MSDMEAILETGAAAGIEFAASHMARDGKPLGKCANCGAPLIGPYCAMCGQERETHRRSILGLVRDLIEDIASFDSRILHTAQALLLQPGELPRSFREGRTRRYVPPLRLYFFVSLVFFLILGGFNIAIMQLQVVATHVKTITDAHGNVFIQNPGYDPTDPDTKYAPKLIPIPKEDVKKGAAKYSFSTRFHFFQPIGAFKATLPPEAVERLEKAQVNFAFEQGSKKAKANEKAKVKKVKGWVNTHVYGGLERIARNPAALNEPLTTWIPRVLFLLLPLYALLCALFYWRQRRKFYLVDHLVFSLDVHTFTFVALIIATGLAQIVSGTLVFWFLIASIGLYVLLAIRRFYEQSWLWTGIKWLAISGIYTIFFLCPALFAVVIYGFLYS